MLSLSIALAICLVGFFLSTLILRDGKPSLGLPVAYLFLLLLNHVPGAVTHLFGGGKPMYRGFTELGFHFTAIGVIAFVAGLWLFRRSRPKSVRMGEIDPGKRFLSFCLIWGLLVTFTVGPFLRSIPSVGAAVDSGSKIWLIAVLLALPLAFKRRKLKSIALWIGVTFLYPAVGLVSSGFLSYGTSTSVQAFSLFPVRMKSLTRFYLVLPLVCFLGIGLFVTYFSIRNDLRDVVWGGGTFEERAEESARVVKEFNLLDPTDEKHLDALDQRLNQNVFVGMAAYRLATGQVAFYRGRTISEGLMSLVPRLLWPDKPVYGGSPEIIDSMTYFVVNEGTSFGVGNVMEFYINWGTPSLVAGFVLFGWFLGWLDYGGARALLEGRLSASLRWILPAFALIRPGESIVEMVGGGAAAWVAALGWGMLWDSTRSRLDLPVATPRSEPLPARAEATAPEIETAPASPKKRSIEELLG